MRPKTVRMTSKKLVSNLLSLGSRLGRVLARFRDLFGGPSWPQIGPFGGLFFVVRLSSFSNRVFEPLRPDLGPKLEVKSEQKRGRVGQNQHFRCFAPGFVSGPFPGGFWPPFGVQVGSQPPPEGIPRRLEKRDAKSTPKHCQKGPTWTPRLPPRGFQNRSKIVPGPSPRASMKRPGTKCPLGPPRDLLSGWILVPWAPFQASILDPFGSSRGPPKEPKTGPKTPAILDNL